MKAILVIDEMPSKCEECPLCVDYGLYKLCVFGKFDIEVCPMKPLPKRLKSSNKDGWHEIDFKCGWNDCLEEIER